MKYTSKLILTLGLAFAGIASAQTPAQLDSADAALREKLSNLTGEVTGLNESYLETKAVVDKLAKLSFGGYIQAQWQLTSDYGLRDSTKASDSLVNPTLNGNGVPTVAGGNFPAQDNQRFQIRRARLKASYTGMDSKYVLEMDVLPSGLSVKDAYVQLTEPWLHAFSLTLGNMDMPFGFEIGYSSGSMESPERSRLENNIFKGEKQLGAKIEVNPTEQMGFLQFLNLKTGLYTGTEGGTGGTGDEVDRGLEVIGRAGFKAPFNDLGLAVDGGVSFLYGKVQTGDSLAYSISTDTLAFIPQHNLKPRWGEWKYFDRKIMGVDMQVYYTVPVIGDLIGGSSLRGEYVQGTQPGTAGSSNTYTNAGATGVTSTAPNGVSAGAGSLYIRQFSGFYLQFIQNLGDKVQGVVRYDQFDPNTKVSGKNIGDTTVHLTGVGSGSAGKKALNNTDLKYSTLGFGLTYFWDANLKFLAYYDMPMNEEAYQNPTTAKAGFNPFREDISDNVLTLRMQVKF